MRLTLIAAQVEVADNRFEPGSFGQHSPQRVTTPLETAAELAPQHPALRLWPGNDNHQDRCNPDPTVDATAVGCLGPLPG